MPTLPTDEPVYCDAQLSPGTLEDPPAFCGNVAYPGEEQCPAHLPDEPDPDRAWKVRRGE